MLLHAYLFTWIFLQAAAGFEPISLDYNWRIWETLRETKNPADLTGEILGWGIVDVDTMSSLSYVDLVFLMVGSKNDDVPVVPDFSTSD